MILTRELGVPVIIYLLNWYHITNKSILSCLRPDIVKITYFVDFGEIS